MCSVDRGRGSGRRPGQIHGALCRAIWADDPTASAAAWRELGRRAAEDGWARRLLFDVIEGKLFLPPDAAVPGLRGLAEVNPEMVLALLRSGSATSAHVAATALGRESGRFLPELLGLTHETEVAARLAGVVGLAEAAEAGSCRAVERLGALVQAPTSVVRRAATEALGRARGGDSAERAAFWLSRAASRGDEATLADQLCEGEQLEEGLTKPTLAAWTMLVSTFYNLDITRTRN